MYTNRIRLIGEINSIMYARFTKQLHVMEITEDKDPIVVELCSEGGSIYAALAISGRIRASSREIYIVAYGQVMSSAVLILASGDYRYISPEAWVMLHESQHEDLKASTTIMEVEAKQAKREEKQWAELLSELSKYKTDVKTFLTMTKNVVYLTADETVKYGLADEVISRKVL